MSISTKHNYNSFLLSPQASSQVARRLGAFSSLPLQTCDLCTMGWLQFRGEQMFPAQSNELLTEWQFVPRAHTLPGELQLCIFAFIAQEDHDVRDNVSCMLVCKLWYLLITQTRRLWTTISITFDCYSDIHLLCNQVEVCIKYSQNAMLDIVIQVDSLLDSVEDGNEDDDEHPSPESERNFKPYIDFMRVLTGENGCNTPRWRSFQLWIAGGLSDKTSFYFLRSLMSEVPHLEHLEIRLGYLPNTETSWETDQLVDILPGLNSLQNLTVDHRLIFGLHSFRPSLIVQLTLIDSPSVREFMSIGVLFTGLRNLVVDLRDGNVISGRDVAIPSLTDLKVSGWSTLEFISHLVTDNLANLDIADAEFAGSHLVGSNAYASIIKLSWRSRDATMVANRACIYVTLLSFILTQCSVLVEIHLGRKHQEVFMDAIAKARREGPVLKFLRSLKVYNSGWEFNEGTIEEVVDIPIPGEP